MRPALLLAALAALAFAGAVLFSLAVVLLPTDPDPYEGTDPC